jgi:YidC/Oxa1 family membrane protein insertase
MPYKNLLLFLVVAAFILAGWWVLHNFVYDQAQVAEAPAKTDKKGPTTDTGKVKEKEKDKEKEPPKDKEKDKEKDKQPTTKEPVRPSTLLTLGGRDEYYIKATITTRGGGIQNLTLPKFQKADENGQPVFNPDGTETPLQLIEDDPFVASFLMYHYPAPDDTDKVTSVDPTLGLSVWEVVKASAGEVKLRLLCKDIPGCKDLQITKTYTLKPREYHISLRVEIENIGTEAQKFRYQLSGSHGLPIEGEWFTSVYRTPMIGVVDERGNLRRNLEETQYRISTKDGGDKVQITDPASRLQFAGTATQFFASVIAVDDEQAPAFEGGVKQGEILAYCRPTLESEEVGGVVERIDLDPKSKTPVKIVVRPREPLAAPISFILLPRTQALLQEKGFKVGDHVMVSCYEADNAGRDRVATYIRAGTTRRRQIDDFTVRTVSVPLNLAAGKKVVHQYLLYHGPVKVSLLADFGGDKAVDPELVDRYADTLHLAAMTDYRSAGPFGWVSSKIMFTNVLIRTTIWMHWLLDKLHWLVPNYGLAIILLTLLVRGAMFPVSRRSALLSIRMQALAPEIKKVQEKYKNDPQAKTAAIMELYRKHGVNPFGSCLPMLLQLPFFLGLYYCLQESIHFRLAGFLWMDNLAAPDMLIRWGEGIPIISDPDNMFGSFFSFLYLGPYLNVLPVIAVALMLVQQKMMTPPPADEQQEMQQKMMKYMFIFIGIMFYKVAAGLCVYFIISSLWGLCEKKMLPKKTAAAPGAAPAGGSGSPAAGGGKPGRGKGRTDKKDKKPDGAMQKVKDWWADVLKKAQKK